MTDTCELDGAPWNGYDSIEKHGEPWDTFIAGLDVDGTACSRCDKGCGGSLVDNFTDDGHRFAMHWRYMALIVEDGVVKPICETCAVEHFKEIEACDICGGTPCACDDIYDRWRDR